MSIVCHLARTYIHQLCTATYLPSHKLSNVEHCWRRKDRLINDVLLWTPIHGCTRISQPAKTYIHQLCTATYLPSHKLSNVGYCWRRKDRLINDVLLWTPIHGHTRISQPAKTYISSVQTWDVTRYNE